MLVSPVSLTSYRSTTGLPLSLRRFSSQSKGGVLKDWPADVLEDMTTGLVIRLASQRRKLSEHLMREIAESMWEMVKADVSQPASSPTVSCASLPSSSRT